MRGTDTNPQPYFGGDSGRLAELEELVNSYATTNEVQRKRIDELFEALSKSNRRAETAEAKLARVDDYLRYVAQSWDANCAARSFEEWVKSRVKGETGTMANVQDMQVEIDGAMAARIKELETAFTAVPWSALRSVIDAAFQFAQGNGELWAECEQVEAWVEANEIGDESCETIHPETWKGSQQ
jgi:hypothetical protein